MIDTQQALIF